MEKSYRYGKKIDTALNLWIKLARAYSTFSKKTGENIKSSGLTQPQFGVIECLGHLGSMTIGTLCDKLLVSGGNMTLVVDNLEKEGYVERVYNKEDRRTIIVRLTLKGRKLFESIFPGHAEFVTKISSVLSEKEQEQLAQLLKKLGTEVNNIK